VTAFDAQIETACAAYAKATDYYVEFHRGLSSESSDRMRRGMRAALTALGLAQQQGETLADKIIANPAVVWLRECGFNSSAKFESTLRAAIMEACASNPVTSTEAPAAQEPAPLLADIAQIIAQGWSAGRSPTDVAEVMLREFWPCASNHVPSTDREEPMRWGPMADVYDTETGKTKTIDLSAPSTVREDPVVHDDRFPSAASVTSYNPSMVEEIKKADAASPEASFDNAKNMLNWLNDNPASGGK